MLLGNRKGGVSEETVQQHTPAELLCALFCIYGRKWLTLRQTIQLHDKNIKRTPRLLALVALIAWSAAARAQYTTLTDIPYSTEDNAYARARCKLDVHYSRALKDAPVVVWFHGGGIEAGNKHIDPELQEQAYLWRMLQLMGHPKVKLYEMQGFGHGAMLHPAYHVLKEYIKHDSKWK